MQNNREQLVRNLILVLMCNTKKTILFNLSYLGTSSKSYNALNLYSDSGRNQVIIRPTAKPREALVDAPAIVAPPDESEQLKSSTSETHFQSRSYYQNT